MSPGSPGRPRTFGAARRWLARFDILVGSLLGLYVLLLANIIVFRHPLRLDMTRERTYTLSQATLQRLKLVREEILVVIPTFLQMGNNEHLAQRQVLERARLLLREYMAKQPLIRIAAQVDVFTEPEKWTEIRGRFGLTEGQVNRFIFFAGASGELRQTVTPADMADLRPPRDPAVAMPQIADFHGERALTNAIARLLERDKRIAYFTQDKEELSLRATLERGQARSGLTVLSSELETQGIEVRALSLSQAKEIPADCQVLVVAGAFQSHSPSDLDTIRRYLQRGGRLFVALGSRRTGLEELLAEWGVEVRPGKVQASLVLPGTRTTTEWVTLRRFNPEHPITRVFQNVAHFELRFYLPRALAGTGSEKLLESTPLVETAPISGRGLEESHYLVRDDRPRDPPLAGSFQLAMAVEQERFDRPPPGFQKLETRLVVVGASNFLQDDFFLQGAHRDFFMNSTEWLLGREERATVSGQEWTDHRLRWDRSIEKYVFWVPVALLPATFLAMGAFVYYLRRT